MEYMCQIFNIVIEDFIPYLEINHYIIVIYQFSTQ